MSIYFVCKIQARKKPKFTQYSNITNSISYKAMNPIYMSYKPINRIACSCIWLYNNHSKKREWFMYTH